MKLCPQVEFTNREHSGIHLVVIIALNFSSALWKRIPYRVPEHGQLGILGAQGKMASGKTAVFLCVCFVCFMATLGLCCCMDFF